MFDGKGVRLHNSRFSLDHDRGGQIILDPTVGFALGQNGMFEFDDDGKVVFNESKANAYIGADFRRVSIVALSLFAS